MKQIAKNEDKRSKNEVQFSLSPVMVVFLESGGHWIRSMEVAHA